LDVADRPPLEQELVVRVTSAQGRLSKNDEKIIKYLRRRLYELPFHTSESLAIQVGVSRAAVVRLAHKLGYEGFVELRNHARNEARASYESPLARFTATGDRGESASAVEEKLEHDRHNLLSTKELVRELVPAAAQTLAKAETVYVLGNRKSFALALYFHRLVTTVRPHVHLVDPGYPDDLVRAGSADVITAFLFRRYSKLTVSLLDTAITAGASTVILTDGGAHSFLKRATYVLPAVTETSTLYQSMVAPVGVLEALAAEVASIRPSITRASLAEADRFAIEHSLLLANE
jgi:DNA-binding MurR/RpiR family transcriptional regulator